MKAKLLFYVLPAFIVATIHLAEAQQPTKVARIGYLSGTSSSFSSARVDALRQGLNELGYFEGKNIVIEYRFADGKPDRLPVLAKELVGLKLDVVVATTTASVLAVKKASETIPIVVVSSADPIASGLVASLARPGGNITGLTILAPELSGKRLELLKEVVPNVTRV
jgi:putative ABC transport system substrate-binding protein